MNGKISVLAFAYGLQGLVFDQWIVVFFWNQTTNGTLAVSSLIPVNTITSFVDTSLFLLAQKIDRFIEKLLGGSHMLFYFLTLVNGYQGNSNDSCFPTMSVPSGQQFVRILRFNVSERIFPKAKLIEVGLLIFGYQILCFFRKIIKEHFHCAIGSYVMHDKPLMCIFRRCMSR